MLIITSRHCLGVGGSHLMYKTRLLFIYTDELRLYDCCWFLILTTFYKV